MSMFDVKCVVVNCHVTEPFVCDFPNGISNDFILIPASEFIVKLDDVELIYPPYTAFYFPAGTPFYYTHTDKAYCDYFIHFSHDNEILANFALPPSQPIYITDYARVYNLMELIAFENTLNGKNRNEILDNLMKTLFLKLSESTGYDSLRPHFNELYDLRSKIYLHPEKDWSLDMISELLHMSPNYIHRLYKEYFNTTCLSDVINCRIKHAQDYLAHTNHSIYNISILCGYNNTEHFCRQFKKNTGINPQEYRNLHK